MKAREYLNQLKKLNKMIENKLAEREQWKAIAQNVTPQSNSVRINGVLYGVEKVQSNGSQSKMADAVERYIDVENEINECIDALIDTRQEIISVIEQLATTEYDILHKLYVQYFTLHEVAEAIGYSYSWVTTAHGRALKQVQNILDSMEKERSKP